MLKRLYYFVVLTIATGLSAQEFNVVQNDKGPQVAVRKTNEKIILDGVLDEGAWQSAEKITNFAQFFPTDSLTAEYDTEVYFTYDDNQLYVAVKCFAADNNFAVSSLKRDYGFRGNDNFTLLLDTFADAANAFVFGMNPYGARREATICCGGREFDHFDNSWVNKWDGESKIYDTYWISEMTIPFNSIRFASDAQTWRFNVYRYYSGTNEISSYMQFTRNNPLMTLAFMGELNFEEPLKKAGSNISLIPYVSAAISRDFEDDTQTETDIKFNAGGDVKLAITSGLNLDLTVNPDFSQVEVDRQVTNLDRFEIFFPERRQFFLENADLFSSFNSPAANPFFSRRIGIAYDEEAETNVQNAIIYGARVTGKLNQKTRVGLMNMQTGSQKDIDLPSYNYSILATEYLVSPSSSIALIGTNKQASNYEDFGDTNNEFSRLFGGEYRLRSTDNLWTGKMSLMKTFSSEPSEGMDISHLTRIRYNTRNYFLRYSHLLVGNGFDPELGFSPRNDVFFVNPTVGVFFYPVDSKISQHSITANWDFVYKLAEDDNVVFSNPGWEELSGFLNWRTSFSSGLETGIRIENSNFTLLDDFDPTRIQEDDIFYKAGEEFSFTSVELSVRNNRAAKISYSLNPSFGQFYDGERVGVRGNIRYRYRQFGTVAFNFNYNRITLGEPFVDSNLWLIGPRFDITFSRKHFWTTFIQYNNQSENVNINTRFQWRFQPVSDFFLVYTHNYLTDPTDRFATRNRALIAKLTYWFNV